MLNETAVLFHFPMESIMRVTHHRCPKQCRKYIVDTNWDDLEKIWNHTFFNELRVEPSEHNNSFH